MVVRWPTAAPASMACEALLTTFAPPAPPSLPLVLLPLPPQSRRVHPQHVRRLLLRPASRQDPQDVLPLHLLHGVIASEIGHRGGGLGDPFREGLWLQHLRRGKDHRPLDGVAQLAHVP